MSSTSRSPKAPWQAPLRWGLGLGALLGLAQALGWVDGGRVVGSLPDLCAYHRLTGWDCPGCGMTRALVCLTRGDWRGAWALNPWSLPLLGGAVLAALLPADRAERWARRPLARALSWALLAALLAWWLGARVLPHWG